MIFFTVANNRTVSNAYLLAGSIKKQMPDVKVVLCLAEEVLPPIQIMLNSFHDVILAKDIGVSDFYRHIFKFTETQLASVIKGRLFEHLFRRYPDENLFIYLDPEMYVFGPLEELISLLEQSTIVLIPYQLEPDESLDCAREISLLKDGAFHGGLIAVRKTAEAGTAMNWWVQRMESDYQDTMGSLFMDQKWEGFFLSFCDTRILRHGGYNVGAWNLHERAGHIRSGDDRWLRCFNFTNYNDVLDKSLRSLNPNARDLIRGLTENYFSQLAGIGTGLPGTYNYFYNGEHISEEARIKYRTTPILRQKFPNPFTATNADFLNPA